MKTIKSAYNTINVRQHLKLKHDNSNCFGDTLGDGTIDSINVDSNMVRILIVMDRQA